MTDPDHVLQVSVVVPVYRGRDTLPALIAELTSLTTDQISPGGRPYRVSEVLLVWDRGPDRSDDTIRQLSRDNEFVRPIWLSRNFGQHAATLAGMTSSSGDWIVTMDEDGQQDPAFIGSMIDVAYDSRAQLVYAAPTNRAPHGFLRNAASRTAKWLFLRVLANQDFETFNSYRLIAGEVGRSVAAYTGQGVYLDVALSWVVSTVATAPVVSRDEGRAATNYNTRKLAAHFGRLVLSSGTRPLLFVSLMGFFFVAVGAVATIWVISQRFIGDVPVDGWASTFIALLVVGGAILLALGIIAQYVGASANMSLGKPLYVVVQDPALTFPDDPAARA